MLFIFVLIWFLLLLKLLYTYTASSFYGATEKSKKKKPGRYPLVSVLVPAWNEEVGLEKTINSVVASDYPNIEIIIIDDGSKDRTYAIARKISRRLNQGRKVKVIHQKNGGKFSALNNGISHSKGSIIMTLDADSYVYPDAIGKLVSEIRHGADVSFGQFFVGNRKKFVGKVQYYEYIYGFFQKQYQDLTNGISIFPGAFSVFKRSVYDKIGLYTNEAAVEDVEHSVRSRKYDIRAVYVRNAFCVTEGPDNFKSLINQRVRWKHGVLQSIWMHRELLFKRISKRSLYYNFIEFPLLIINVLESMTIPFFWGVIIYLFVSTSYHYGLAWLLLIVPFLTLLICINTKHFDKKMYPYLPLVGLMFYIISFIECISTYIASLRMLRGVKTSWTVWNRVGV